MKVKLFGKVITENGRSKIMFCDEFLNIRKQDTYRRASRVIILDKNGKICLLDFAGGKMYKFPGGGLENNESFGECLKREVKEECGFNLKNIEPSGYLMHYKNDKPIHLSLFFTAKKGNRKYKVHLTEKEKKDGLRLGWYKLEDVFQLYTKQYINNIEREEYCVREYLMFLKYLLDLKK